MWREVRVLDSAPSTNAVVAAEAASAEGLVVVAEHQTAGRGRLDRMWVSPPRAGLTFSVLLRPRVADNRWSWLPLVIGVAVAEAVEEMSGVGVGLKWPNDLLVDGRKVGGILLERHDSAAVVGVGINVTSTADELPGPEATSLLLADAAVTDRESLLRAALRSISRRYAQWSGADDAAGLASGLASAYTDRCETLGADVQVRFPDGSTVVGRAERIDDAGRLVVVDETGEHALSAGDVFHVRTGG
jgi:BirA family biotin operon repressor/biotin-[acetyl-CoA-carboxylase] ligase